MKHSDELHETHTVAILLLQLRCSQPFPKRTGLSGKETGQQSVEIKLEAQRFTAWNKSLVEVR